MINFCNMHYSRAVQFSEVILIFVRIHLHLVTAAFATFPPAGVQQATFLTSFLILHLSSMRPTCLWIYSWLSYTTCLFSLRHSQFYGFSCISLLGLVSCLEQVDRGDSCWWLSSSRDENLLAQGKGGLQGFCFVGFFEKQKLWR